MSFQVLGGAGARRQIFPQPSSILVTRPQARNSLCLVVAARAKKVTGREEKEDRSGFLGSSCVDLQDLIDEVDLRDGHETRGSILVNDCPVMCTRPHRPFDQHRQAGRIGAVDFRQVNANFTVFRKQLFTHQVNYVNGAPGSI